MSDVNGETTKTEIEQPLNISEAIANIGKSLSNQIVEAKNEMMLHFDKKFDGLSQRVTQLEEQSVVNSNNIAQVTIIANDAKSQCSSNSVALGTLETETTALSESNASLLKRVEALEKQNDILAIRTNIAEQRLEDQTNRALRKTLIIQGVAEEDHEGWKETHVAALAAL